MLQKTLIASLLLASFSASAHVYECRQGGKKVLTDVPCEGGRVITVTPDLRASGFGRSDRVVKQSPSYGSASVMRRYYVVPRRQTNKQACDITRRSINIQKSSARPDQDRLQKLRKEEAKYCQ